MLVVLSVLVSSITSLMFQVAVYGSPTYSIITTTTTTTDTCPTCDPVSSPPLKGTLKDNFLGASIAYAAGTCDNPPKLPSNCVVYTGTQTNADWLWCWHINGLAIPAVKVCASQGLLSGCDLTDNEISSLATRCNQKTTMEEKLDCVLIYINTLLNNGNVCRHHARCTKKVLEAMGIEQNYITKGLDLTSGGHAWNEVNGDGGTYYIDSYNGIKFWCPTNGCSSLVNGKCGTTGPGYSYTGCSNLNTGATCNGYVVGCSLLYNGKCGTGPGYSYTGCNGRNAGDDCNVSYVNKCVNNKCTSVPRLNSGEVDNCAPVGIGC